MHAPKPLISVIVITYQSSGFVLDTLESIKALTYRNVELIISDDGSTDHTVNICRNWLMANRHLFRRTELLQATVNTGIAANINRGIKNAKGDWIKIVAGDDALLPDSLDKYAKYFAIYPDAYCLNGKVDIYQDNFRPENKHACQPLETLKFNLPETTAAQQFQILLRGLPVYAPAVILHRKVFEKVGLFNEKYRLSDDRPMWLKMTLNNIKMVFINETIAKYRKSESSTHKAKNGAIFPLHDLDRDKAVLKEFGRYLKSSERIVNTAKYAFRLSVWKLGLNRRTPLATKVFKLSQKVYLTLQGGNIRKYSS